MLFRSTGHGFATLRTAQAMGDIEALERRDRAVLHFHLEDGSLAGLPARGIALRHVNLRLSRDAADIGTFRLRKIALTSPGLSP